MYFRYLLFLSMALLSAQAIAYELLMVQAISDSKRSFITRTGKRQGVIPGFKATFTADNVSILARARSVHSEFTQWEIINPEAIIPFHKGTLVTFYPSEEHLWGVITEEDRQKYILKERPHIRESLVFKSAIARTLSESVSGTSGESTQRGGLLGEALYEKELTTHFSLDGGLRYDNEVINTPTSSLTVRRAMLVADLYYYFNRMSDFYEARFYLGLGLGYGQSFTQSTGASQSGSVILLPGTKFGINLPFNDKYDLVIESAFEALQTKEKQPNTAVQSTTQTNLRVGVGLKRYF